MKSSGAIYVSIAANCAIAVTKFFAAALSGSSVMIAEGVHSCVDALDDGLLLLGQARSRRPPDPTHPFGHGKELYFWTLIVALLFFAVGGGMSVYEGIRHILSPESISDPRLSYAVLGISLVFDAASFVVGLRALHKQSPGRRIVDVVRYGKDPSVFTVVLEDIADMAGLGIAGVGVFLSVQFKAPWIDGAASVGVGLVLAGVAVILAGQSRGLLIGERASPAVLSTVEEAAREEHGIVRIQRMLTMHLGPDEVLLVLDVEFTPNLPVAEASSAMARIEDRVRDRCHEVTHIYVESRTLRESARNSV